MTSFPQRATRKALLPFIAIVLFLSSLMALTTPTLIQQTRIGLEFKGGYEILYEAQSLQAGQSVERANLLETAKTLSDRANRLGVAEPDVIIEGTNQIRIKLAGVSNGQQVRDILNQPGNLPLNLTEKYSQTVGGVLGEADLRATLQAGLLALTLVFVFMVALYGVPGLIAVFTLSTYLWLLLLVFNVLHATLSLAAIVAFVLGLGIASDANILSYERIKEELRKGKEVITAVRDGEHHALRTILDANATGLIGAIALFIVGIGPIRGFALTTMLSILISLVSNVFLSRLLLNLLTQHGNLNNPTFFGAKQTEPPDFRSRFSFVQHRYAFLALSVLIAAVGAFTILTSPLNLDIDFKAGTALDVTINQPIDQETAIATIEDAGIEPATVAIAGTNSTQIAARFDDVLAADDITKIVDAFKEKYGSSVAFQENTADPAIAQQLVTQAIYAIGFAILGVFVFVMMRFGWRYAIAACIAILNSAFFVLCMFSIFKFEIDVTFIAAILTVIGYSVNDTIVVFDRIRENLSFEAASTSEELEDLVNQSIWQILKRSLYTVLTVITGALCLFYLGAEPLHAFALAIFYGLLCGAYSSIFIAAPMWWSLQPKTRSEAVDLY